MHPTVERCCRDHDSCSPPTRTCWGSRGHSACKDKTKSQKLFPGCCIQFHSLEFSNKVVSLWYSSERSSASQITEKRSGQHLLLTCQLQVHFHATVVHRLSSYKSVCKKPSGEGYTQGRTIHKAYTHARIFHQTHSICSRTWPPPKALCADTSTSPCTLLYFFIPQEGLPDTAGRQKAVLPKTRDL